eukprot:2359781-Prymnesium_polylepis.2
MQVVVVVLQHEANRKPHVSRSSDASPYLLQRAPLALRDRRVQRGGVARVGRQPYVTLDCEEAVDEPRDGAVHDRELKERRARGGVLRVDVADNQCPNDCLNEEGSCERTRRAGWNGSMSTLLEV